MRLPSVADGNTHVYNQYTIRAERRDELKEYLKDEGIGSGVYYPVPLHLQNCFASLRSGQADLPVSEVLCTEVLSLPIFPELAEDALEQVAQRVRSFFG